MFHSPPDRLALRSRLVAIDLEQLTGPPAVPSQDVPRTLTLNLFDDAVFTAIVEHTAPTFSEGVALSGRLERVEEGTFTPVANGAVVASTVRTLDEVYSIRSAATAGTASPRSTWDDCLRWANQSGFVRTALGLSSRRRAVSAGHRRPSSSPAPGPRPGRCLIGAPSLNATFRGRST